MNLTFPSPAFDDALAAVCHGTFSEAQARALNVLLRADALALDEYLLRLEVHSRLGSEPDYFASFEPRFSVEGEVPRRSARRNRLRGIAAAAACVGIAAMVFWGPRDRSPAAPAESTSKAVAMLNQAVFADWMDVSPACGEPLEPGPLRLKSGLAQIVLYSGARLVVEGPAEFELISQHEVFCRRGRVTAEVPPQASGFRIHTGQASVKDLGTAFGLLVRDRLTEVHVFSGRVEVRPTAAGSTRELAAGSGIAVEDARPDRFIAADASAFEPLFNLQNQSVAAEALRHDRWREASGRLNEDPSLLFHLDFEGQDASDWRLHSAANPGVSVPDATIVGCQWTSGRWPEKRALEFRGVSDRVRLSVPGEFEAVTLAAWVRVQGLDRQINSLFMCDGFAPGTLHWLVRHDGVLGLTVIGEEPQDYQITATRPILTLDQFGRWLHLAVVVDTAAKRVTHYANGQPVGTGALRIRPPFRIGAAELGNWNPSGFPGSDPFHIRNFSGAMDEFLLFNRALSGDEVRALHAGGEPQPATSRQSTKNPQNKTLP